MTRSRPATCAVLVSLLLACGGLRAETPDASHRTRVVLADDLELRALGEGLWIYVATVEMNGHPVGSNGLVVEGDAGAIVIDTPWNDELTALLLDWIESEVGEIGAVVSTHFHADRLGGIGEVRRRGIASYGHAETARLALADDLLPPETTFERELTLSTGSQTVELFFPGPGHTADNTVAWLPGRALLFGGCLLKSTAWGGLGFIGDAVIEDWAATLDTLLQRYPEATTVWPGHGEAGGLEVVLHTRDLVRQHLAGEPAGAVERQRGVSWVAQPYEVEAKDFDALVAANVGWIAQTPFGWQDGVAGAEVELHTDGRIYWGERDVGLETTTRLARERGIKTLLKPHIWVRRANGKWRSDIAMESDAGWDRWFASYSTFILHYARLAERLKIELFCVGTELRQTVLQRPDDWRRLLAEVRSVYSGKLTYAANWYREPQEVPFWDQLDYIGIQAYYPLSDSERPSLDELKRGWSGHIAAIEELQRRFAKPVLFTEIGYKSTPGATAEPWVWLERDQRASAQVDLELQADAYRAFFEVVWSRPWMAGAYFWKWYPRSPDSIDADFTPQGKPAERVLGGWYGVEP